MRGKQIGKEVFHSELRITPACAGKTSSFRSSSVSFADHPRVCGENALKTRKIYPVFGSPPRVRGKRAALGEALEQGRITPACAGKTSGAYKTVQTGTDHPRVCGENNAPHFASKAVSGSPPRVRGKLALLPAVIVNFRITPACAGKTLAVSFFNSVPADHPRVCGENAKDDLLFFERDGSPPRVRGKLKDILLMTAFWRITPACAGKTRLVPRYTRLNADHPRVCGENIYRKAGWHYYFGSPPRVRGKPVVVDEAKANRRITPACAGKTL